MNSGMLLSSMFKIVSAHTLADDQDLEDELVNGGYYPKTGSFIDVSGAERVHVLIHCGTLGAAGTFKLYEHDSATGTPTEIDDTYTWYEHTIGASDDGDFIVITLEVARMSLNHHFLTTLVNESGANYAVIIYLLQMYGELPPTQTDYFPVADNQHYFTG